MSIEKFKVTTCRIGGGSSNLPKEWGREGREGFDKNPGI